MTRRLKILTWHVHGNYLYYLSHIPHDLWLVRDDSGAPFRTGRSGSLPWPANVYDAPVAELADMRFDAVLYQSPHNWEHDRVLLSAAHRELPSIALEHDPPRQHPTDTRHWASGLVSAIVHVTPFNALMWDNGPTRAVVIEHGIAPIVAARYSGEIRAGISVVNHLARRGRRLGLDVFEQARENLPLVLAGMGSESHGGLGEIAHDKLAPLLAHYRFFFHPVRYTSLGLAVLEAMFAGMPVVALASAEIASVLRDGDTGFVDSRPRVLQDRMIELLEDETLARALGERGRRMATQRFAIGRFVDDWHRLLRELCS